MTNRIVVVLLLLIMLCLAIVLYDFYDANKTLEEQIILLNTEVEMLSNECDYLRERLSGYTFFKDSEWMAQSIPYYSIPLSNELQHYTYAICLEADIVEFYEVVLALMWQESNFRSNIISKTNDYGIMQINVVNHEWLKKKLGITDFLDPYQNIYAGVHIFASLLKKYKDPHKALMAYNFGEAGAQGYWSRGAYTSSYSRGVLNKKDTIIKELGSPREKP